MGISEVRELKKIVQTLQHIESTYNNKLVHIHTALITLNRTLTTLTEAYIDLNTTDNVEGDDEKGELD
jgi:hypothetical protein